MRVWGVAGGGSYGRGPARVRSGSPRLWFVVAGAVLAAYSSLALTTSSASAATASNVTLHGSTTTSGPKPTTTTQAKPPTTTTTTVKATTSRHHDDLETADDNADLVELHDDESNALDDQHDGAPAHRE